MRCQTCGASNSDDARFCVNCGQKLEAEESLPGGSPPYQRFGGSTYEPFGIPTATHCTFPTTYYRQSW